ASLQDDVRQLELPHGGEDGNTDRVKPEQDEDATVSPAPDTLGQAPAFRHEAPNARTEPPQGGGHRDEIHRVCYRRRGRTFGPQRHPGSSAGTSCPRCRQSFQVRTPALQSLPTLPRELNLVLQGFPGSGRLLPSRPANPASSLQGHTDGRTHTGGAGT